MAPNFIQVMERFGFEIYAVLHLRMINSFQRSYQVDRSQLHKQNLPEISIKYNDLCMICEVKQMDILGLAVYSNS